MTTPETKSDGPAVLSSVELDGHLCQSCKKNPATDPHACPFAEEIGGNDDQEYCTCCLDCQSQCAMDI